MADTNNELVRKLEENIGLLLSRYHSAKEQIENLQRENNELNEKLSAERNQKNELEERFNIFRLSTAIAGNPEDKAEAKRRIGQIVREIDKCIALLNQ